MDCEFCGRNNISKMILPSQEVVFICDDCIEKINDTILGVDRSNKELMDEELQEAIYFYRDFIASELEESYVDSSSNMVCPNCGYRWLGSNSSKLSLGCPTCYETFRDEIENFLLANNKVIKHVGISPNKVNTKADQSMLISKIVKLKSEMEEAVELEEYERAAKLRDQVEMLRKRMSQN